MDMCSDSEVSDDSTKQASYGSDKLELKLLHTGLSYSAFCIQAL